MLQIKEAVIEAIRAATPDVEPHKGFTKAPNDAPIEELPQGTTTDEATRDFQVTIGISPLRLQTNAPPWMLRQEILVKVRYWVPRDIERLYDLAGTDAAVIKIALEGYSWPGGTLAVFADLTEGRIFGLGDGLFVLHLRCPVTYFYPTNP